MSFNFFARLPVALSKVRPAAGGVIVAALALSTASPAMAQRNAASDAVAAAKKAAFEAKAAAKAVGVEKAARTARPSRPSSKTKKPTSKRLPLPSIKRVPPPPKEALPEPKPDPVPEPPRAPQNAAPEMPPPMAAAPQVILFEGKEGPQVTGLGRLDMNLTARDLRQTKWPGAGRDAKAVMLLGILPDGKVDHCAAAFSPHNIIADYACAPILRTARFRWDPTVTPPPYGYILVQLNWIASTGEVPTRGPSKPTPPALIPLSWAETWSRQFPDHQYALPKEQGTTPRTRLPGSVELALSRDDLPQAARDLNMFGSSDVQVTLRRDGSIASCRPAMSGASMLLDLTTCDLVMQRGRYVPKPGSPPLTDNAVKREKFWWNF